MQQVSNPPAAGKVALKYGLIFGLIVALIKTGILVTNAFVNNTSSNTVFAILLVGLDFLLGLAAYFVVGILTAKQTAKVSTGTIAGLWAGLVYGFIGIIVSLLLFFTINLPRLLDVANVTYAASPTDLENYRAGVIVGGVGFAIFGLLFTIGLGAGLGVLGGLIGKSTSKVATESLIPTSTAQPYPYQPNPYQPYPGQPNPYSPNPYQPYPGQPNPYPPNPYPPNPYQPYPGQPNPDQESNPPYYEQPR